MLELASMTIEVNNAITKRAAGLQAAGYGAYDACIWPARKRLRLMFFSRLTMDSSGRRHGKSANQSCQL